MDTKIKRTERKEAKTDGKKKGMIKKNGYVSTIEQTRKQEFTTRQTLTALCVCDVVWFRKVFKAAAAAAAANRSLAEAPASSVQH